MFRNYFKTALRNLTRNKSFTIINIAGLSVGIAVCMAIFIIIRFELSFENVHAKKARIYRVLTEYHHADAPDIFFGPGVPQPLPFVIGGNIPGVQKAAPVYTEGNDQILVLNENGQTEKKFKEEKGVFFTTPAFFEIFDFPLLAGNPATVLKDPNTAIVTKQTAERYFGDWQSAMGKTIKWNNRNILKITGILGDIPSNTDFQLKLVIAFGTGSTADFSKSTNWDGTGSSYGCYVLLQPNVTVTTFNAQLREYVKKMKSPDNKDSHILQPLGAVHYETKISNYSGRTISHQLINALWLISAFILMIACVNFINLSTAQAVNRAKEIDVRKVLGGNKGQLKLQFITETFLIVVTAVILAILICAICFPFLSRILAIPLSFNIAQNPVLLLFLFIITVTVTVLAGFYPSLVLSSFNPISALKSKLSSKSIKGISLRRALVVFQFVIAQALIIGTFILIKQMNYFTSRPLGFDKDAIVNVPFPGDSTGLSKLDFLRNKLLGIKGIQHVSFSSNTPAEDDNDNWTTFRFDNAAKETEFFAINKWADNEYVPTYRLPLVAGRNLNPSDTAGEFLVNELLLKNLGITDPKSALNKEISLWDGYLKGPVVGVLKDFNARSFRRDLAPVFITSLKRGYNLAGIKLATLDISASVRGIEKTWSEIFPDFAFEYQFLDAKIDNFYKQESQLSSLYKIFAAIAIFLSCLGLYGLASFMAAQRIKEVGIRKVLGATAANIVYLFSREFIILIVIAFAVATPIAWYYMHQWLQDYVYRIEISWWMCMLGGLASVIIALATVSFQAIKAAIANPVKSLRTE